MNLITHKLLFSKKHRMKRLLHLIFTIITALNLHAQIPDTLHIYSEKYTVVSGEMIEIPVLVSNYVQIEAIQFSMNWNPHQFEFVEVSSINPESAIEIADIGLNRVDKGIAVMSFIDPYTGGITLPDSAKLFSLRFKAIGAPSARAPFNISGFDRQLDAYGQSVFRTIIAKKTVNGILPSTEVSMFISACGVTTPSNPNGSITVTGYGEKTPLRLQFAELGNTDPVLHILGNGTTVTFDNLNAQAYDVRILDSEGNTVRDTIKLKNTLAWQLNLNTNPPSCGNLKDGSASITNISGFEEPYVFVWSTNDVLNPKVTGLGNGTHFLRVVDDMGCVLQESFTFNVPIPEIRIEAAAADCEGSNDGRVKITIYEADTLSDGPFTFILNGGAPVDTSIFAAEDLSPGRHSITVIDGGECEFTEEFFIDVNHRLTIYDTTTLNIGCDLSPGGFLIEVRDTGILEGKVIPLLKPDMGEIIQNDSIIEIRNLPEGTYTLYLNIEGANSLCGDSLTFQVTVPSLIEIHADAIMDESCAGNNDGLLDIRASGGLGSFYNYMWSDGVDTPLRENLSPGEYCITITDDSGCVMDSCFTILPGSLYTFTLDTVTDLSCHNIHDGLFAFNLNHISGPVSDSFEIKIIPDLEIKTSGDTLYYLDSLRAGAYFIEITSIYGCKIDTFVNIGAPAFPTITLDSLGHSGCFNSPEGFISLSATLDDSSTFVKWDWSNGDSTAFIDNLTAGTYRVTVTDINDCSHQLEYFIDSLGGPVVEQILLKEPSCYGDENGSLALEIRTYKAGIESIVWNESDTTDILEAIGSGLYTYEVRDSFGCVIIDSVYLSQPDSLQIIIETEAQTAGSLGTATAHISGGTEPYDITWSTNPQIKHDTIISVEAGIYSLIVIDKNLCLEIVTFQIDNKTSTMQGELKAISLYPNPTSDILYLESGEELSGIFNCKDCAGYNLYIFDASGKQIQFESEVSGHKIAIHTENFIPGQYFIAITKNNKVIYNNKFFIQRL